MASTTAKRESEITRTFIREKVRKGPKTQETDVPAALGTLFSRVTALSIEVDRERILVNDLLNDMIGRIDRQPEKTVELDAEADLTADVADGRLIALRKALMKKVEEGAEESPQSDAELEEENALLASEDLWPTFIEVMKGVADDLKSAHLSQMTTYQRLLFAAKKQMRYPSQDPWETENFKKHGRTVPGHVQAVRQKNHSQTFSSECWEA